MKELPYTATDTLEFGIHSLVDVFTYSENPLLNSRNQCAVP